MNIFERASRLNLTFDTIKGVISFNDLWKLPLTSNTDKLNLDDIACEMYIGLQSTKTISFVDNATKADDMTQLRFDIVKHIIGVKLAEREAENQARIHREKKNRIMELIARKEDQALADMPLDELRNLVKEM